MNGAWFGDSYDIVKRFFVRELQSLGYRVCVDPMPSGDWESHESAFLGFLGVTHVRDAAETHQSALLIDPDTGIGNRRSRKHASIDGIVAHLQRHEIIMVFDQSFSRSGVAALQIQGKLQALQVHGMHGFYYDSHARFLFASQSHERIDSLRNALIAVGLPKHRLVMHGVAAT